MSRSRRRRIATPLVALAFAACGFASAWARTPDDFADLVDRVSPSVVNISVARPGKIGDPGNSLGSGFIIDAKGVIVTNNHVVANSDEITVVLATGEELKAKVAGRDPATDIAILRVTPKAPLPAAHWGDSKAARVGNWVLAVGNPYGLGSSVSVGIISARNRDLRLGRYDDFIQTDAAINLGSSGGALFDMDGAVIGVTSALVSPSGNSAGIGFAAPSESIRRVVADLMDDGAVLRGWLGVTVQDPGAELASPSAAPGRGALVTAIDGAGPASKAGLRIGDVIYSFNGVVVTDTRALNRMVADSAGKRVRIDFQRSPTKRHYISVDVSTRTGAGASIKQATPPATAQLPALQSNGLTLASLTPALRKRFGVKDAVDGVLVSSVDAKTDAAGKVQVGDVLMEIDFNDVRTPGEAKQRLEASGAKPLLLAIHRDGATTYRSLKRASQ